MGGTIWRRKSVVLGRPSINVNTLNFAVMPELQWAYGYPTVMGGVAVVCLLLYRSLKKAGWL